MSKTDTIEAVRTKFQLLQPLMTERLRRQWAACEAESLGRGGVRLVAEATGLSRTTIWAGRRELRRRADRPHDDLTPERVRAPGGGRPAPRSTTRPSSATCATWSNRPHGGIRNRLCAGLPRARGGWPRNCATRVMR